ncbi:MAG: glycosyltransferase family 39 protein [Chloroflexota bacterium]|nr:glycosyltransferase family 39 protein [Chloroflexota bacterium]
MPDIAPVQAWLPKPGKGVGGNEQTSGPDAHRADLRNLLLIAAGWMLLLVLLPPAHDYPVIDDWIYSASVQQQLNTGVFTMPGQSQASLVGLTLWGTGWARLFGFSTTVLTYSTLFLALAGLLTFYALARTLKTPPAGALLGTALLGLNPIFLHLSYSFMTDVPFLALVLIACYAYVRGLQPCGSSAWLLVGGVFSGWAFLIRQFGVLVPLGFLAYLFLNLLTERRWNQPRWWWQMLGVGLLPAFIAGGWLYWSRDTPPTQAALSAEGWRSAFFMKEPWLRVSLLRVLALLVPTAFTAWTAIRIRRTRLWLIPLSLAIVGGGMLWASGVREPWIGQTEQPFIFRLGSLAVELPQKTFNFGGDGNIMRVGGIDFFEYHQQAIWSPEVWRALYIFGSVLGALLLAKACDSLLDWAGKRPLAFRPDAGFYMVGLAIAVVTVAASGAIYDRYVLGFGAFMILFAVREACSWGRIAWGYSLAALVVLSLFSVTLKADAMDHTNARFLAGYWFQARGASAMSGLDWNRGLYYSNPEHIVTDLPVPGFRTDATFPYTSRLSGFTTRYVLAQTRTDLPPPVGGRK